MYEKTKNTKKVQSRGEKISQEEKKKKRERKKRKRRRAE